MGGQEIIYDGVVETMGPINSNSRLSINSIIDTVFLVELVSSVLVSDMCHMIV